MDSKENENETENTDTKHAGALIARRSNIDIMRINDMFKLDNILSQQPVQNEMECALQYLLNKLVGADTDTIRKVLSTTVDKFQAQHQDNRNKYKIYLPTINDLRSLARIKSNPNNRNEMENSKSVNWRLNNGEEYVKYPIKTEIDATEAIQGQGTYESQSIVQTFSKNRISATDLCSFNQTINKFMRFGLIVHGFEHDSNRTIYDEYVSGFTFSEHCKSFYNNIQDNGTGNRYKNFLLIPFFKQQFSKDGDESKENIFSIFWDVKIGAKGYTDDNCNVDVNDWHQAFNTQFIDFTRSEAQQLANKMNKENQNVIQKKDFINFMMNVDSTNDRDNIKENKDETDAENDKKDSARNVESRFVEYILKDTKNRLHTANYRNKFYCQLLFNILTIEGIPFDMMDEKKENNNNSCYCVSCTVDSSSVQENTSIGGIIAACYDKNDSNLGKKMLFGYPIINESFLFDLFHINGDSIDVSLTFGQISKFECKECETDSQYRVRYDNELFKGSTKIRIPEIIECVQKRNNNNGNKSIVVGSGEDFTVIHSSKLIDQESENSKQNDRTVRVVYCIQAQFIDLQRTLQVDTQIKQSRGTGLSLKKFISHHISWF